MKYHAILVVAARRGARLAQEALGQPGPRRAQPLDRHQATEHYYKCAILVLTAYWPYEHDIKYLGKQCANLNPAFHDIFPVEPQAEKRRLELLEDAYVKARYSLKWTFSRADLEVLAQRIAVLRERTSAVCQAYIDSLSDQPVPA